MRRANFVGTKFGGGESEGGVGIHFPLTPFSARPARAVWFLPRRRRGIIRDFVQKRFELRSVIATKQLKILIMAEEKPTKSDATGSPTEKFNLKLFLLMSAVYIGITFLLVNTLGLIVAGIVFAAMRKGRGSREALLFSLLAGIGNFFNEFYKLNGIFTARDLSISVLSGLFFALTAFGAVELIGFIGSKFRNKK